MNGGVSFGHGIWREALREYEGRRRIVVADRRTAAFHPADVVLECGEGAKSLDSVRRIWQAAIGGNLDRGSLFVAIGGGTVTDVTGFAAATYLRGVDWVAVPTTLVGMCDAALGGKTAIDLDEGKNLIGAFHPPLRTVIDLEFLNTLPERELKCGESEIVKTLLACGVEFSRDESLESRLRKCVEAKLAVVAMDPRDETGERAVLNAGHTVGHALERVSDYQLKHGEAVAAGLVIEAMLAERAGVVKPEWKFRLAELLPYMKRDKKNRDGEIVFEIPTDRGIAVLTMKEEA